MRGALCAALALLASPALAQPAAGVDLAWSAPTGCPDEATMRAAVERLAGRSLSSPGGPRIAVRIEAAPDGAGAWSVRIIVERPGAAPSERRIAGASCPEVANAAAVAAALAIEPEPPAPLPIPLPPAPVPAPVPENLQQTTATPRLRPGLRTSAGVDFAALPSPSVGLLLAFPLIFGANRVELHASAWLPQSAASDTKPSAGGRLSLVAGGARYCRSFIERSLGLAGCASFEAGAMLGRGYGVASPTSGASPWAAPGAGLLGTWNLTPHLSLALGVEGLVPLVRSAFEIENLGQVYRPRPLTARAALGVEMRLW